MELLNKPQLSVLLLKKFNEKKNTGRECIRSKSHPVTPLLAGISERILLGLPLSQSVFSFFPRSPCPNGSGILHANEAAYLPHLPLC
ncbi:MAG: hypothetical protein VX704_10870, partial [Verrucomicrobiota bacterium]|nr:hypothetical protein [Verrucomicrobiota bacterium]